MDRADNHSQSGAQAPPVCIAGMHRSGTSMVAKLLQQAGLYLGSAADLMPPAAENPEGFFEHLELVRLNDEALSTVGAGWDCPPPADVDWHDPGLDPLRARARALTAPLAATGPWGWKDPRNSLTLPFWRSALGPFPTVVVLRNPLEVVTSLHRRNGFSLALGLTLWRLYAERILADTTPQERLVTHFDAYFLRPEAEIARVLAFFGLQSDQTPAALREGTIPALRHHRRTALDLEQAGFPPEIIDLYADLCREADWWEGVAKGASAPHAPHAGSATIARGAGRADLLRVENEVLRRNNADFDAALANRETRIAELEMALRQHEAARVELEGRVAERDGRLHERHNVLARKDHAIGVVQRELAEAAAEAARLREQVAGLTDRLEASERSRAVMEIHERELRTMLTSLQEVQLQRDAEIMGTLGAVLSRHAPGAPASIYYRHLVSQVRRLVETHVPAGSRLLVATYGDDGLLALGDRQTAPFPRAAAGVSADYTDISGEEAVAQLEALRDDGAEFLLVPSPALPWLANHPELGRHLDAQYAAVVRDRAVGTIYTLGQQQGRIPA